MGLRSCNSRALKHRLSSCGTDLAVHGTWDLPSPGMEPTSPAFTGGFLSPGPQGKPQGNFEQMMVAVGRGSFLKVSLI